MEGCGCCCIPASQWSRHAGLPASQVRQGKPARQAACGEHSKTHQRSQRTVTQAWSSSLELERPRACLLEADAEIQDPTYCTPSSPQCRRTKPLPSVFHTKIHLSAVKKPQRCGAGDCELEIQQDPATACVSVPPSVATNRIPAAAPTGAASAPGADGCSAERRDSK